MVATTGLDEKQVLSLRDAAASIPVFFSANMSMGISLIMDLAKKAASVLGGDFDVEILEKHHNQKVDAPSGTALMLADAVSEGLDYTPRYVFDRHDRREKRAKAEIGFSSIRGGTIVGEHEVIFAGTMKSSPSPTPLCPRRFSPSALNAALYLAGRPAGLYSMKDFIAGE